MAESRLTIERKLVGKGAVLLTVKGIVDAKTFDRLEAALQEVLDRGGGRVVVELAEVGYISSAGIGVLMNAMSETHRRHGELVLLNPGPEVAEIFDALHLTGLFKTASDLQGALAFFAE
jgi:anti-sigma B factor antagonist